MTQTSIRWQMHKQTGLSMQRDTTQKEIPSISKQLGWVCVGGKARHKNSTSCMIPWTCKILKNANRPTSAGRGKKEGSQGQEETSGSQRCVPDLYWFHRHIYTHMYVYVHLCTYTHVYVKTHPIVCFKYVHFILCQLYINKVLKTGCPEEKQPSPLRTVHSHCIAVTPTKVGRSRGWIPRGLVLPDLSAAPDAVNHS